MNVDLVITYVDNTNKEWLANYTKQKENSDSKYFRVNNNALKYLLRSVDKNLTFINNVFLIVQNESEVPHYIDTTKVTVITHDKFIPNKYLPTFNSNTIETFLGNIKELSQYFLYMNDDFIITKELSISQFYTKDEKAITYFYTHQKTKNDNFYKILVNNNKLIWGRDLTMCVNHTIRPYIKSLYNECYRKYWDNIAPTLTKFRNTKNYSLYIVDNYQNKVGKSINAHTIINGNILNNASNTQIKNILNSNIDTICIHDIDENIDIYKNKTFQRFLKKHFSIKSKYEQEAQ